MQLQPVPRLLQPKYLPAATGAVTEVGADGVIWEWHSGRLSVGARVCARAVSRPTWATSAAVKGGNHLACLTVWGALKPAVRTCEPRGRRRAAGQCERRRWEGSTRDTATVLSLSHLTWFAAVVEGDRINLKFCCPVVPCWAPPAYRHVGVVGVGTYRATFPARLHVQLIGVHP